MALHRHADVVAQDGRPGGPRRFHGDVSLRLFRRGARERPHATVCAELHAEARWQAAIVEAPHGPGGIHHIHCGDRWRHREGLLAVLRRHHADAEDVGDEHDGRKRESLAWQGLRVHVAPGLGGGQGEVLARCEGGPRGHASNADGCERPPARVHHRSVAADMQVPEGRLRAILAPPPAQLVQVVEVGGGGHDRTEARRRG
mmetsp:Transcript_31059/g.90578  ORF Transcript_31059/g.90578 Transcript_31059/m.90578 type:complete len:201 (+) Transcript_31059:1465-2067(+)